MVDILNAVNRAEVFRYLAKPWQQEELVATVQDAFARRDALVGAKQGKAAAAPAGPPAGGHDDVLRQLEQDEPGITRVDWDEHGNIRLF
jgi:DNA-binding NtrC family response regulator